MIKPETQQFIAELEAAEAACDAALATYTKLMMAAQSVTGLKFGEVQPVYADITEAMNMQLRGRHHLARAHGKALEIAERRSMLPTNWGDTMPTYDEARDAPVVPASPLRIAA